MPRIPLLLFALLIAAATVAVAVFVPDGDDRPPPSPHATTQPDASPAIPETINVDGADADTKRDDPVPLSETAENVAQDFVDDPKDLESEPGETPLAGSKPQIGEGVIPAPMAADEIPGCRTRFLKTNFSARGVPQSRVVLFWLHFTGGPDIPGTRSEVDGLTGYGSRASARVSWHFNMDKDGNCDYNVPLLLKAWTEANANPTGISIEVAGVGSGEYLRAGGVRQLSRILSSVRQAYPGVKLSLGGVRNCMPTKGGIVTHWQGGPCSGGHTDIKPHDIGRTISRLRAASGGASTCTKYEPCAYTVKVLTPGEKRLVAELLFRRRVAARHGGWAKVNDEHQRAADKAKAALRARRNEIARLGLTRTNHRGARHAVIGQVLTAK